jgi:hypothetical protein
MAVKKKSLCGVVNASGAGAALAEWEVGAGAEAEEEAEIEAGAGRAAADARPTPLRRVHCLPLPGESRHHHQWSLSNM